MQRPIINYDSGAYAGRQRPGAPGRPRAAASRGKSPARSVGGAANPPARAGANTTKRFGSGIGALQWAAAGFLVGIVFWHFVGFWDFLGDVVLNEGGAPATKTELAATAATAAADQVHVPPSPIAPAPQLDPVRRRPNGSNATACSTLVLERATGRTISMTCPAGAASRAEISTEGRPDLAGPSAPRQVPQDAGWSATLTPVRSPALAQGR